MTGGALSRFLDRTHGEFVHDRRTAVLSRSFAAAIPAGARLLDVGTGDGLLASRIAALRADVTVEGVDVLLRPDCSIPVFPFDGKTLPFQDASWDAVMLVDVVHHAEDAVRLLRECARVASGVVLIKDHLREGLAAEATLRFMDWVGNARHGVRLPYRYFNSGEWNAAFRAAGLHVERWDHDVPLYPGWARPLFGRRLHFIAVLRPVRLLADTDGAAADRAGVDARP